VAARLARADPSLWLSRSWTTRRQRPGEADDAYVFVDRATFEDHARSDGFFEWANFLGNLYGTPRPEPGAGRDVLLEIDLQGAREVRRLRPEAVLILLLPPSADDQEARLRARGDDEAHIADRVRAGAEEERSGRAIADAVVVNHDVAQATADVAGIVEGHRTAAHRGGSGGSDATIPRDGA
jgi:guanylate kinase